MQAAAETQSESQYNFIIKGHSKGQKSRSLDASRSG